VFHANHSYPVVFSPHPVVEELRGLIQKASIARADPG